MKDIIVGFFVPTLLYILSVYCFKRAHDNEINNLRLYYEEIIRGMQFLNNACLERKQKQVLSQMADVESLIQALQMSNKNVIEAIRERDRKDEYIKSLEEKLKLYLP